MPKIDIAAMRQRIQTLNNSAAKMHEKNYSSDNATKTDTKKTEQSSEDKITLSSSARDVNLKNQLDSANSTSTTYSNAADGLSDIKEALNSLKELTQNYKDGNLDEDADPNEALKSISSASKDNSELLKNVDLESLGLKDLDIKSEDAMEKIENALKSVDKADEEGDITKKAEIAKSNVEALNNRKEQFAEADKLIKEAKQEISGNPYGALNAQGTLNSSIVSQLLG